MGQNNIRKSANKWCEQLNIKVLDLKNQFTEQTFNSQLITMEEFLNRISNCSIEKPNTPLTRRQAALLKTDLMNKLK